MQATADPTAFYHTALLALLAQEHHAPTDRRFGDEADARWAMFHGHLNVADRIDLLLRDAAVSHPAAFSPRTVFGFAELAEDEPFGPDWQSPFGRDTGKRAWKQTLERRDRSPEQLWQLALETWEITPEPLELRSTLAESTEVLVVGTGALAALAQRFIEAPDELDWSRQVLAVTESPAGIQLAGLASLCTARREPARVLRLDESVVEDPRQALERGARTRPDVVIATRTPTDLESRFAAALRDCW